MAMNDDAKNTGFLVVRVPTTGPRALIAPPNDFKSRADAERRIAFIEAPHRLQHHTFLEIVPYTGDKFDALRKGKINY